MPLKVVHPIEKPQRDSCKKGTVEGDITLICRYMVCSKRKIVPWDWASCQPQKALLGKWYRDFQGRQHSLAESDKKQVWHIQEETRLSPECYGH